MTVGSFEYHPKQQTIHIIEVDKLEGLTKEANKKAVYLSWIERFGKGKGLYSSPSYNA